MTTEATTPAAGEAVVTPVTPTPVTAPSTEPTTVAPATEPAEGQTGEPAAVEQGQSDDKPKKPNRISAEERIKQSVARQRLAERERDAALRREAELRRSIVPQNVDQLSFEDREALRLRQVVRGENAEGLRAEAQRAEQERLEAQIEAVNARNEGFRERLTEFEQRDPGVFERFASLTVTEDMAEFISDSPVGPEMASYLSKEANAKELRDLQRLTDPRRRPSLTDLREADRLMSRIEARISHAPTARKATTAPAPGTTLNGGHTPPVNKGPAEMTDAEYSTWYKQRQKAARAR